MSEIPKIKAKIAKLVLGVSLKKREIGKKRIIEATMFMEIAKINIRIVSKLILNSLSL